MEFFSIKIFLFLKLIAFIFNFLFHNSQDKFDRQMIVSNQIESWQSVIVLIASEKEFVVTEAQTHRRGQGTASVTRLGDLLNFGQVFKPLTTINLPKSPTFLGNFCIGAKIFHFSSEIIFG